MEPKYESVYKMLLDCMETCNHCYDACLKEEDVKMMSDCIRLDRECADICSFTAQSIVRSSPALSHVFTLCAAVCEQCAEECAKHEHEHCKRCAEACRKCADACRQFAA